MGKRSRQLIWVKGHNGVKGSEAAGGEARKTAWVGKKMLEPGVAALAGIRQAFPMQTN